MHRLAEAVEAEFSRDMAKVVPAAQMLQTGPDAASKVKPPADVEA